VCLARVVVCLARSFVYLASLYNVVRSASFINHCFRLQLLPHPKTTLEPRRTPSRIEALVAIGKGSLDLHPRAHACTRWRAALHELAV